MSTATIEVIPPAAWTNDCQGKKDYDGDLISISSRYWPPNYNRDGKHSAHAAIHLNLGPSAVHFPGRYLEHDSYRVWRDHEFVATTEARVKEMVERWVQTQVAEIVALLGGLEAFSEP